MPGALRDHACASPPSPHCGQVLREITARVRDATVGTFIGETALVHAIALCAEAEQARPAAAHRTMVSHRLLRRTGARGNPMGCVESMGCRDTVDRGDPMGRDDFMGCGDLAGYADPWRTPVAMQRKAPTHTVCPNSYVGPPSSPLALGLASARRRDRARTEGGDASSLLVRPICKYVVVAWFPLGGLPAALFDNVAAGGAHIMSRCGDKGLCRFYGVPQKPRLLRAHGLRRWGVVKEFGNHMACSDSRGCAIPPATSMIAGIAAIPPLERVGGRAPGCGPVLRDLAPPPLDRSNPCLIWRAYPLSPLRLPCWGRPWARLSPIEDMVT